MTTATYLEATPRKLRDGSWGAAIQNPPADINDGYPWKLEIRAKSGTRWIAYMSEVIFSCDAYAIVRTCKSPYADLKREINGHLNPKKKGRLVGYHTTHHCSCGNWSGVDSPCLYSYGEAKDEGEHRSIRWEREGEKSGIRHVATVEGRGS